MYFVSSNGAGGSYWKGGEASKASVIAVLFLLFASLGS